MQVGARIHCVRYAPELRVPSYQWSLSLSRHRQKRVPLTKVIRLTTCLSLSRRNLGLASHKPRITPIIRVCAKSPDDTNLRDVKYAKEFGIGSKTGIDIPGELSGTLPSPEWKKKRFKKKADQRWLPGDLINMSIGQGYVLTTPVQIASAYQAIANNGVQLKPTVVDRFVTYSGKVENNTPKVVRKLNVSPQNLKLLQNALRLPVSGSGGTVKLLRIPNYPVSAKTGTAQNTGFKDDHSWIAGYFPSDKPEIVFVSIVEGGGYGGVTSGNMALKFIQKYRDKYVIKKAQQEMLKKKEAEEKKKQQQANNNKNLANR